MPKTSECHGRNTSVGDFGSRPARRSDDGLSRIVAIYRLFRTLREEIDDTRKRVDGMDRLLNAIENMTADELNVSPAKVKIASAPEGPACGPRF